MKSLRLVLFATTLAVGFAATTAKAQVGIGVGVGPAVVAAPADYGPPACEWGYYSYYPYACAPYGYYGPHWFHGGVSWAWGPGTAGAGVMDGAATAIGVGTVIAAAMAATVAG